MTKPEYVIVAGKKYKINTDYRVALECEKIAQDYEIDDFERALAIIYKLFGEEAINDKAHWNDFFEKAKKYFKCGKEEKSIDKEPNISFEQDESLINASFMSDYKIDLETTHMHLWTFFDLLNGLTENCVLNRIRFVRDFDLSTIKDSKERQKWKEQKELWAIKKKKTLEEIELDKYWEEELKKR